LADNRRGGTYTPTIFGERHSLFVIIALGETLIVAASGVTDATWTGDLLAVALLAVAVICGLWWSYFPRAKPVLDEALASRQGAEQSMMARDVFSLIHFPMLCGVIACAVSVEKALAHPGDPLPLAGRVALAVGLALFVGGMAVAIWRATRQLLVFRVVLITGTAIAAAAVTGVASLYTLAIAFVGLLIIAIVEHQAANLVHAEPREPITDIASGGESKSLS
jgi:low temperature requirement protein LtrA